MANEVQHRALARYLEDHGLKHTRQRDLILDVFLEKTGHTTFEELYQRAREQASNLGSTTVYRTMKLLWEAGLASERHFDDGITRYEIAHEHHDHLVCTRCGTIVEFECEMIEKAQDQIAKRYGFRILRHRHELYGLCENCQSANEGLPTEFS